MGRFCLRNENGLFNYFLNENISLKISSRNFLPNVVIKRSRLRRSVLRNLVNLSGLKEIKELKSSKKTKSLNGLKVQRDPSNVSSPRGRARTKVPDKDSTPIDPDVFLLAQAYETQLRIYTHKPNLRFFCGKLSRQAASTLTRATVNAGQMGMEMAVYVKSQFWWFDKHFSRAPKLNELSSTRSKVNSLERARQFKNNVLAAHTSIDAEFASRSIPTARIAKSDKFRQCEDTLHRVMCNFGITEEQVFRSFTGNSIFTYFDISWLRKNPTYCRLKTAGEI